MTLGERRSRDGAASGVPEEIGAYVEQVVTHPVAGAGAYTGPTEGRAWSPEYGYYEGRTDGPKNSSGEPCMQGRDNDDPNC